MKHYFAVVVLAGLAFTGCSHEDSPVFSGSHLSSRQPTSNLALRACQSNHELFWAVKHKDAARVGSLLAAGACPDSPGEQGELPLLMAARRLFNDKAPSSQNRVLMMRLLLQAGANPNLRNTAGETAFDALLTQGVWEVPGEIDNAAFLEGLAILLRAGADLSAQSLYGGTPLAMALRNPRWSGFPHNAPDPMTRVEFVRKLLAAGADPNSDGGDLILETFGYRTFEMGDLLIQAGADVRRAPGGWTRVYAATSWRNANAVRSLVRAGADVSAVMPSGDTALRLALEWRTGDDGDFWGKLAQRADIASALIDAGAHLEFRGHRGQNAAITILRNFHPDYPDLIRKLLARRPSDLNEQDELGWTALMWATYKDCDDWLVRALHAAGADPNLKSTNGRTALQIAIEDRSEPESQCAMTRYLRSITQP